MTENTDEVECKTARELLSYYPTGVKYSWTFEEMLESSLKLHKLDPLIFKYIPFLEDEVQLSEDAFCIFEQCVAVEKGWA